MLFGWLQGYNLQGGDVPGRMSAHASARPFATLDVESYMPSSVMYRQPRGLLPSSHMRPNLW